jgi:hypothetical protein
VLSSLLWGLCVLKDGVAPDMRRLLHDIPGAGVQCVFMHVEAVEGLAAVALELCATPRLLVSTVRRRIVFRRSRRNGCFETFRLSLRASVHSASLGGAFSL